MIRVAMGVLTLLLLGPALQALDDTKEKPKSDESKTDKPQTPAQQYRSIVSEYQKQQQEYFTAIRQAKTQDERQKVFQEKYPKPDQFAGRMMELAEKNPKDEAAVDALAWIITNGVSAKEANKATEILFRDHLASKKLAEVCQKLMYSASPDTERNLRTVREKSPHHDVKGIASYSLAIYLKNRTEQPGNKPADVEKMNREVEKLFEQVEKEYADVKQGRSSLGEQAKSELFEIRNLAIGKTAPDIEGEDGDGKKFKLSDYRGKVVVLDFWARW